MSKMKKMRKGKAYKCDSCVRSFVSLSALQTHQRVQHNNIQPGRTKQSTHSTKKTQVKDDKVKETPAVNCTMKTKRTANVPNTPTATRAWEPPSPKVDFECPRCFLSFDTHIIAAQHIAKVHYPTTKVPINVQPVRKELCLNCKRRVTSIPTHICTPDKVEELNFTYNCLLCSITFGSYRLLCAHVAFTHLYGVESLFFPSNYDFEIWKQDLEYQTNASYSQYHKIDSKYYAHCTQGLGKRTKVINICPSFLILQEFPKGIQVHYYGQHCQHQSKSYKLSNKFKKYAITSYLKSSDSYTQKKLLNSDDNNLYSQFKQLMESMVLEAAKVKKETLTILYGHALEMTSILTAYNNDEENISDDSEKPVKRNMTRIDIEKALEEPSTLHDASSNEPLSKKPRPNTEAPSPMIVNTFSLADIAKDSPTENSIHEKVEMPSIKVKDIGSLQDPKILNGSKETPKEKAVDSDSTPSSFNESFAVFLEKNFADEDPTRRRSKRVKPLKTKIGQYKPSPPKVKFDPVQNTNNKYLTMLSHQQSTQFCKIAPKAPIPSPLLTAQLQKKAECKLSVAVVKANDVPYHKNIIMKPKKLIEDTPNNVTNSPIGTEPKQKTDISKLDIKYEVKEQADDCNILILKI